MLKIYNTLSHLIEEFIPLKSPHVGMYSCGPTVYDFAHIGHMRTYVGTDILIRALKANGFEVKPVMNITDVGHLTSDADTGEDKMEKGAKKFGMSVWDIAKKFEAQFKDSCQLLNITLPTDLMHATDYIREQIELIKQLEGKGFTYKTADGIYFDTSKFKDYFKFSRQNPEELKGGIRVDLGDKKNISDFALWKFSPIDEKRQMEWESPWGMGFPGWHIECSAMSMKALGESFDVHTGGVDHINIHHTNEIAQSEAVTGKQFVKYWVHYNHLLVEGEKMSKSLGNFYTAEDIVAKGFDPLSLRYLFMQTHYRQEMNFTWDALKASQTALNKLRTEYYKLSSGNLNEEFKENFLAAVNDDLNLAKALALIWEEIKKGTNRETINYADEILGLKLAEFKPLVQEYPKEIQELLLKREELRKQKNYEESDKIRDEIIKLGYEVKDN